MPPKRIFTQPEPDPQDDFDAFDESSLAGLAPVIAAIRAHPFVIAAITCAALAACTAWLARQSPQYEAHAQILVTPLTEGQSSFVGLPILRTSPGDPTRTIDTAATMVSSSGAASRVASEIGGYSASEIRSAVEVEPVEGTNVLEISAAADDPELAAEVANAYADGVIEVRREQLRPLVRRAIRRTERELRSTPNQDGTKAESIRARLSELDTISDGFDPTLAVSQRAETPTKPLGRPAWQTLAFSVFAGLLLGIGTAMLVRMAASRQISDDEALLHILDLPILSRAEGENGTGFALLRSQLVLRAPGVNSSTRRRADEPGTVIGVLGVTPSDGATSATAGLASTLAQDECNVIGIDLDPKEPALRGRLGIDVSPKKWLTTASPADSRAYDHVTAAPDSRRLAVAVADAAAPRLRPFVADLRDLADYVVVDLGSVVTIGEALPLLRDVDRVILVVRYGHTRSDDLTQAAELLSVSGLSSKAGFLVIDPKRNV